MASRADHHGNIASEPLLSEAAADMAGEIEPDEVTIATGERTCLSFARLNLGSIGEVVVWFVLIPADGVVTAALAGGR